MGCGCTSSMDGINEAGYMDSFQGQTPAFKPELNFSDVEDLEDKEDFVDNDEGQFDNFLTKRMRARRKARKDAIKEGASPEEARAIAQQAVPKTKLGSLVSNTLKGTTDVVTDEIVQASQEGVQMENVPPVGTSVPTGSGSGIDDGDKKKNLTTALVIGGVAVAILVGGYFAFGKKLGLRK